MDGYDDFRRGKRNIARRDDRGGKQYGNGASADRGSLDTPADDAKRTGNGRRLYRERLAGRRGENARSREVRQGRVKGCVTPVNEHQTASRARTPFFYARHASLPRRLRHFAGKDVPRGQEGGRSSPEGCHGVTG